ncbi:MAG: FtsX-like permease family protein [Verrucomicrobiota bacterium]
MLLFIRHSLRYLMRHKLLTLLHICGVALGVAVFVSIQIVNQSALTSFRSSVDLVAGKANFTLDGRGELFNEEVYQHVVLRPEISAATPVLEELVLLPEHPGAYLNILGIDPFSNTDLSVYSLKIENSDEPGDFFNFFSDPSAIAITKTLAQQIDKNIGDSLLIKFAGESRTLTIHALLEFEEGMASANPNLSVMDIANAQHILNRGGKLSRIDGLIPATGTELISIAKQLESELRSVTPAHVHIGSPQDRNEQTEKMIGAFQLNLTALSLIALLVGSFLIYNTVATSVTGRRHEIGLLRSLGMQRWQVQLLFIGEALFLSLPGIALGLLAGLSLSTQLISSVSSTISSLYTLVNISSLNTSPQTFFIASLSGFLTVLAAAWLPAREAARVDPVLALSPGHLSQKSSLHIWRYLGVSIFCCMGSILLGYFSITTDWPWLSFPCALLALLVYAFLVPATSVFIAHHVQSFTHNYRLIQISLKLFTQALHRHSISIAALVAALSMMIGLSIMIHSFRTTVTDWIGKTIRADIYISPISNVTMKGDELMAQKTQETVLSIEGIAESNVHRSAIVYIDALPNLPIDISATQLAVVDQHHPYTYFEQLPGNPALQAQKQGTLLISDTLSKRTQLTAGDSLQLRTPSGTHELLIQAVYQDYQSEFGVITMDISLFKKLWQDDGINSLALYLEAESNLSATLDELKKLLQHQGAFIIYSNAELRSKAMAVFDETFHVTYVLRLLALIIAGVGIFLTMTILVHERRRELGIIRSCGASRLQMLSIMLAEATWVGLVGTLLGIAGGFTLAYILDHVVNQSFFGWSITWSTPWYVILQTPLWVLGCAILSSLYPAWKTSRLNIAEAVRLE